MGGHPVETAAPLDTIERLSAGFNDCFRTFQAGEDSFAPDAFFDLLPPFWRFQVQGRDAFAAQLAAIAEGPVRVVVLRTVATTEGFLTEHEEHQTVDGDELVARRMWRCVVRDGRIVEATGYCNGGWDHALRARHAAEAPMLRP